MSANIHLVQQLYEFFGQGNIAAIIDHLDDKVEWHSVGAPLLAYAGTFTKQSVGLSFQKLAETFDITEFSPSKFIEEGDTVIAFGSISGTARNTGKGFASKWVMEWKIKNGLVYYRQDYGDSANLYNATL